MNFKIKRFNLGLVIASFEVLLFVRGFEPDLQQLWYYGDIWSAVWNASFWEIKLVNLAIVIKPFKTIHLMKGLHCAHPKTLPWQYLAIPFNTLTIGLTIPSYRLDNTFQSGWQDDILTIPWRYLRIPWQWGWQYLGAATFGAGGVEALLPREMEDLPVNWKFWIW